MHLLVSRFFVFVYIRIAVFYVDYLPDFCQIQIKYSSKKVTAVSFSWADPRSRSRRRILYPTVPTPSLSLSSFFWKPLFYLSHYFSLTFSSTNRKPLFSGKSYKFMQPEIIEIPPPFSRSSNMHKQKQVRKQCNFFFSLSQEWDSCSQSMILAFL